VIYSQYISTVIDTYTVNPQRTILKVCKGLVYKVEVEFPPGPIGLLRCQIYDGGFQLWPSTPGQYFKSDGLLISFDDTYLKLIAPFEFTICTWNDDDTYPHGLTVRIGMVSKELFMSRFLPSYGYQELTRFLREEQESQEKEKEATIAKPFTWIGGE
jgi:hypothetical protein